MSARGRLIAAAGIAAGAVIMGSLVWGLQHAALSNPPLLGRPAPHLAIQTLAGEQVKVWELQGRPVVVNFWASWCGTCVAEGGVLSSGAAAHQDVSFVGADSQDTDSGFRAFEGTHPHPYPAGPIVVGTYQSFGVAGLPETFFINGRGLVVASFAGPLDAPTLDHYLGLITT
ncbi:MAG TPA: redoxin family protein [Patescibacteria group bacterium]|nr:redoxin family protein [Patescibacteria group bacterium]